MTRLIGLTGRAGSGKDTAAEALAAAGWMRAAFADKMRKAVLALDPVVLYGRLHDHEDKYLVRLSDVIEEMGWDRAKRKSPEVRRLLQRFGTEAGRHVHGDDCWVDALFRDQPLAGYTEGFLGHKLVITDCRYDNEARAIRRRGGIVIRIERPGLDDLPNGNSVHSSEAGVSASLVDYVVENDSTIEDLYEQVLWLIGTEE